MTMTTVVIINSDGNILRTILDLLNHGVDKIIVLANKKDNLLEILKNADCCGGVRPEHKLMGDISYTEILLKAPIHIFEGLPPHQTDAILKAEKDNIVFFTNPHTILNGWFIKKYVEVLNNKDITCVYGDYIDNGINRILPEMYAGYREIVNFFACRGETLAAMDTIGDYNKLPEKLFFFGIVENMPGFHTLYA